MVSHFQLTWVWAAAGASVPTPSYALSAAALVQPHGDTRPGADPTGTEQGLFVFFGLASFSGRSVCPSSPQVYSCKTCTWKYLVEGEQKRQWWLFWQQPVKTKLIKFTLLICKCFIISVQGRFSVRERLGLCPHVSALTILVNCKENCFSCVFHSTDILLLPLNSLVKEFIDIFIN